MSSTNKTANYELSQFVGTDIPSILSDYNGDMRKIDAGIAEVATSAGSSASAVSALAGRVTTAENSITSLNGALEVTNQRSIQNQTAITAVQGVIPSDASTENKLATSEEVSDIADDVRGLDTRVTALEQAGSGFVTLDFDATQYSTVNEALNALYVIINPLSDYQKMNLSIEYAQYLFKCSSGTFTAYDTILQPGLSSNNLSISYDRFGITNNSYWEKYTWVNGATQMTTENRGNLAPTMHMKVTYPKA